MRTSLFVKGNSIGQLISQRNLRVRHCLQKASYYGRTVPAILLKAIFWPQRKAGAKCPHQVPEASHAFSVVPLRKMHHPPHYGSRTSPIEPSPLLIGLSDDPRWHAPQLTRTFFPNTRLSQNSYNNPHFGACHRCITTFRRTHNPLARVYRGG